MKSNRQETILRIVAAKEIETQDQLLSELRQHGIPSTQATISRDIKELHLVKELTAAGTYRYAVSGQKPSMNFAGRLRTIFQEGVSFDAAQNIVVVKTMPGLANAAAAALDGMDIPDMVGSLAGDDTILLILRTSEAASRLCTEIHQMLK